MADCYEGLAFFEGQEKHDDALKNLKKALEIRESNFEKFIQMGATHAAISIIYLNKAEFEKANIHDKKGREILSYKRYL